MTNETYLSVFEVVGSHLCFSSADGQKVYDRLVAGVRTGRRVVLSFCKISTLTPAFLNAAIGQLYGEFSEEKICSALKFVDIDRIDLELVKHVTENAKQYFAITRGL
ncbi:MAG: STAS-like domain-containing protein [Desulfuromonadaceae bacterium]|nr:STAS-like domain-containing protein [Desulfuromonadaceae bacterium]